jgi:hypothetical protein
VTRSVVGRCKCPHKAPAPFLSAPCRAPFCFGIRVSQFAGFSKECFIVRVNLAPVLIPMKMAWAIRTGARLSVLVSQNVGSGVW